MDRRADASTFRVPGCIRPSPNRVPPPVRGSKGTALALLACGVASLASGCNDQYADAIVSRSTATGGGRGIGVYPETGSSNGEDGWAGASSSDGSDGDGAGDATLCQRCDSHRDCGVWGDLCLSFGGEARCGKACNSDRDCPDDFDCINVSNNSDEVRQCIPERSCEDIERPSLDEMRSYIFAVVNELRVRRGLEQLQASDCLTELGQEAVRELETERAWNTKFERECANQIPYCDCGWAGESQAFPSLDYRTWQEAVVHQFELAERDPNGPIFPNVVSKDWEHIGIGVLLEDDNLLFSLEFSP
jgi:hypothetical protein